ncbi:hypothetical protein Areg01_81350 [Actinoplanes regularis]|nr:hypothetical protein Areg01_81350 [Actinoplanes regularis]
MPQVDPERRRATVARLTALRVAGTLTPEHVRLAATGLGVTARSVRRWLEPTAAAEPRPAGPAGYQLTAADREAFAYFRGNIAAVARARDAAVAGLGQVVGAPVPDFLVQGWADAPAVTLRTLQRAFERQLTPAELAAWRSGEEGRRAASVDLTRPATCRNVPRAAVVHPVGVQLLEELGDVRARSVGEVLRLAVRPRILRTRVPADQLAQRFGIPTLEFHVLPLAGL